MKFKRINKYQGGGQYTVPVPVPVPRTNAGLYQITPNQLFKPSMPQPDKSAFALPEEAYDAKGLTSDVNKYFSALKDYEKNVNSLSDLDIITQTDKFLDTMNKGNRITSGALINEMRRNEGMYDKAKGLVLDRKAHSAFVTKNGLVYVRDKDGKKGFVSPFEYSQNRNKYEPLSASTAMIEREKRDAFDNTMLSAAETTYGIEYISERLRDEFQKNLGDSGHQNMADAIEGIAQLNSVGLVTHGYEWKNNKDQVKLASDAAYKYLNEDQLTQLRMKAINDYAKRGIDLTPDQVETAAIKILADHFSRLNQTSSGSTFRVKDLDVMSSGTGSVRRDPIGIREATVTGLAGLPLQNKNLGGKNLNFSARANNLFPPVKPGKSTELDDGTKPTGIDRLADSRWADVLDMNNLRTITGDVPNEVLKDGIVSNTDTKGFVTWAFLDENGTPQLDPNKFENLKKNFKEQLGDDYSDEAFENYLANQRGAKRVVAAEIIVPEYAKGVSDLVEKGYATELSDAKSNSYYQLHRLRAGEEDPSWIGSSENMVVIPVITGVDDLSAIRMLDNNDVTADENFFTAESMQRRTNELLKPRFYGDDYE